MRIPKRISSLLQATATPSDLRIAEAAGVTLEAAHSDGSPATFTGVAYSGGVIHAKAFNGPGVVDLSGVSLFPGKRPILQDHDSRRVVGHSEAIQLTATSIAVNGIVSGESEASTQVVASSKNGFPWALSIGAKLLKCEYVRPGQVVTVNGRTFTGPLTVARKSSIYEISFVALPGDTESSVSIAAELFHAKEPNMEFATWLQAKGFAADGLDATQTASLQAMFDAEQKPEKKATIKDDLKAAADIDADKSVADLRANMAAEVKRIGRLSTICKDHPDLQAKAIEENWSTDKAEVEVLKAQMAAGPFIHARTDRKPDSSVLEAAMCQSLGIKDYEKQFGDQVLQAAHSAYRGRMGLQELFLQAAAENGYLCRPGQRINTGNLREVISYALPTDLRASAASTLSLPNILSNVANKELLQGFMEEDQAWREISAVKNVTDFKTVTSYRMLDNFTYEEMPPNATFPHGQLGEETFTRKADTYGKMFALTRTDIINDDMGALDDLRTRLGRGAATKFNSVFWAAFMDNSSFFTAARANYISGATTNLLTDYVGLQLGLTAFDKLKSAAVPPAKTGKRIGGTPTILLVPPELEAVALQIYAPIAAAETSKVNIYSGKFRPVKVHQLSDSTITGYSTTAWYMLRSPSVLPAMVVSFLNGVAQPIVESAEASFDRLGVEFRGYHDFGCDQAEWLCGVMSKGSA